MLTHITIKNLTIIEHLSVDLATGLTVVTGETGAGKSIWVDAVQLAIGARADNNCIRSNTTRGEITLCFDVTHLSKAKEWLKNHAFDAADECILRRMIEHNGRSRCTINGNPVTLGMLQKLASQVLTIHGQHEQHTLLTEEGQQRQIDQFAKLDTWLLQTQQLFHKWQQLQKDIDYLEHSLGNRQAELALLHYQFSELNEFAPQVDEWRQLSQEHQQLAHGEQSLSLISRILGCLQEDDHTSAAAKLQQAQRELATLTRVFPALTSCQELLNQADIYLQEAVAELQDTQSSVAINPEKLRTLEQRLSKMHELARKHHIEPDELLTMQQELSLKITNLTQAEEKISDLQLQQQEILQQYQHIAGQLSKERQKTADFVSQQVTELMQKLAMQGGYFKVVLQPRETVIHPLGQEKIQFLVCTNPGQREQPLAKIVSGGELSRIHLALQASSAQHTQTPTMIFDEIDVGIGGHTAAIVGQLLRQLSTNTQIICITHLPQVAAYGQQHFQVSKYNKEQQTFSVITALDATARVEELARMLGGAHISAQTRAHAAELLTQ